MEQDVYICKWFRSKDGWRLETVSHPVVLAKGSTYEEAEEDLCEQIRARGGAIIPVLEFVPPLPKSTLEEKYCKPELYTIVGDDRFETSVPKNFQNETPEQKQQRLNWYDSFYQAPVCRKCFGPQGPRNERPLELTYVSSRYDSAFGMIAKRVTVTIVSQDFLELLTIDERNSLGTRPVLRTGGRKVFYEILGPSGPSPIAVKSLPVSGWRCSKCNGAYWAYFEKGLFIREFIAKKDLPDPLPGIFTIGVPPDVQLCVTAGRWKELVGRKGTRGMVSSPLGVAKEDDVVRVPELKLL